MALIEKQDISVFKKDKGCNGCIPRLGIKMKPHSWALYRLSCGAVFTRDSWLQTVVAYKSFFTIILSWLQVCFQKHDHENSISEQVLYLKFWASEFRYGIEQIHQISVSKICRSLSRPSPIFFLQKTEIRDLVRSNNKDTSASLDTN